MTSIQPNAFVRLASDPSRSGIVQPGEKKLAGERMVPVRFGDGNISWLPIIALEPVPSAPTSLADLFAEGRFVDPSWLRRKLTQVRVTGRLSDIFYSMEATETDFYAFQFKPVLKLLGSPTDALLIADEVGLGKTIEAGLIWTELRARFESNRLLVVCPKTLREKWRIELRRRFGVDSRIVTAKELLQLLSEPGSPKRSFAAIASMQGLRPPRRWDSLVETHNSAPGADRRQLAKTLSREADNEPLIDLLVVDEAHHMRNPETLTHRLGQLLNGVSAHRILLSATPIHLRSRDLYSLLRLLDPGTFEYKSTIDDLIRANEPIVAARDLLLNSNSTKDEIIACIKHARGFDILANSKALKLIRDDLDSKPLDVVNRAELASRLESVNQMANYMTRTRRRDVEEFRIVREPSAPVLDMHEVEREFYESATKEVMRYASDRNVNQGFLLSTPQRLLTSSPAAASAYWAGFNHNNQDEVEETDDDLRWSQPVEHPLRARLASLAGRLNKTERLEEIDTKFQLLEKQLDQLWASQSDAKVIVFSSFKPTLNYLRRRLEEAGILSELLHGSVHEPREAILKRFRDNPKACVLLSSEVGSEGIDLQFCWIIFNYDLPWNPMKVEQRIGRVDRLGQTNKKVNIVNLVYANTIDAQIYSRLYVRLNLIERTLGEFEAVLGEPIREMTRKLLSPNLNEKQKQAVIDQTAQAVVNRRLEEKSLEQDAGALIRHGDYILQKIDESRDRRRWLNENDILLYVKDRLDRSFPGCRIEESPPESSIYRISLSSKAREELFLFLDRRNIKGTTRLLRNDAEQRYRFTSSVARREQHGIECVSQLHPLVRFSVEQDKRDAKASEAHPLVASIYQKQLSFDCEPDNYVIAIRCLDINLAGSRAGSGSRLAYVGSRLTGPESIPSVQAEEMAGVAADRGRLLPNFKNDPQFPEATEVLCVHVLPELDRVYEDIVARTRAGVEDRVAIKERALRRHRDIKTARLTEVRDRHRRRAALAKTLGDLGRSQRLEGLGSATEKKLRDFNNSIESRLKEIRGQRTFVPAWSDITFMVIKVMP